MSLNSVLGLGIDKLETNFVISMTELDSIVGPDEIKRYPL